MQLGKCVCPPCFLGFGRKFKTVIHNKKVILRLVLVTEKLKRSWLL